jgi:hypothetical protein
MTGLLERLASAFLAPPAPEVAHDGEPSGRAHDGERGGRARHPRDRERSGRAPHPRDPERSGRAPRPRDVERRVRAPSIAVLCRGDDALVAGAAAALLVARRCRSSRAVVAVWGAAGSTVRAPARAGARRLAATLAARGHDAAPTGRLVLVRLDGPLNRASPEVARVLAAAGDAPAVVVLAGARDGAADAVLRDQDAVVVAVPAESDWPVAELALSGLARLGVSGRTLELPSGAAPARALAASGVALVPPLRGPVEAALEGVR